MDSRGRSGRATTLALLGPTNTGKTHRAVERMLEHESGMIGLPLRLLAREVYDRVTSRLGEREVALITGEEKRVPARPRYWICTVEAMPVDRAVDFLAVDEVQLASHPERGHVFSSRLLNARGCLETWFLGSHSAERLVQKFLPAAQIKSHPRLSKLKAAGQSSLSALPARSAVVAFSASRVYELAERIRQKHGGAAVVLGALSPRARNAQVALYQSGEVDYMVATDAIGMGLNLDVSHIAFAELSKFDGREHRPLEAAELAQIAGRAGRYLNDGTFGTLAPAPAMAATLERCIESHAFPSDRFAFFRNDDLDFSSTEALIASLSERPRRGFLRLMDRADDFLALCALASREEVRTRARGPERVALLWDVCRIPDYRGLLLDYHVNLLKELYLQLSGPSACIAADWADEQLRRIDDVQGDIETLLARMAFIRTWTYISYQASWLPDAVSWQERARSVEDRLSDALHERLVLRFVDRSSNKKYARARPRTARHDREDSAPPNPDHPFGKLMRLRDELARKSGGAGETAPEAEDWAEPLMDAPHERFRLDEEARIWAEQRLLGKLVRGADVLRPEVALLVGDLGSGARLRLQRRLTAFARDHVHELFAVLDASSESGLSPAARGLLYQLRQGLGTVRAEQASAQVRELLPADRAFLEQAGVCLHGPILYVRALLEEPALRGRMALWRAYTGEALPRPEAPSLPVNARVSKAGYGAMGYAVYGRRALRADLVQPVRAVLRRAARRGRFRAPPVLVSQLGCAAEELPAIIRAFGYKQIKDGRFVHARKPRKPVR